jgi:nucleoside-diphosphate-sugar epimerase
MLNNKILVLGHRAYISLGLVDKLQNEGYDVTCFSRGEEQKDGNVLTGNVFELTSNTLFEEHYDVVINFILLKDRSINENIEYVKALTTFCIQKKVKRLIHISSISVYANEAKYVNETTPIKANIAGKGAYSSLKIAVDNYLSTIENMPFELCFVRPGFVISEAIKFPLSGIAVKLPLNWCLLLGNKKTSLPLIDRDVLQTALVQIVKTNQLINVYLLLKNNKGTKYSYVKEKFNMRIISLSKCSVLLAASILKCMRILNTSKYQKIKGLFKDTYFDSSVSENVLDIRF